MKTLLKGLPVMGVLVGLTGCGGMTGTWELHSIEPESSKNAFPVQMLCLHEDHTYHAYMGGGTGIAGRWEYDDDAKLITLVPRKGVQRSYKASVGGMGSCLLVQSAEEGKDWKATMKRGKYDPGTCRQLSKKAPPKQQAPVRSAGDITKF